MTAVDASSAAPFGAAPLTANPVAGPVQFLGRERPYWRLRLKGAALVVLTLGIYRFWLATDVRRYLWSNTEIAGDTLEYNGLATELLVGFLFALAILVPLYMALAIVALELDSFPVKPLVFGFLLLLLLGEFALYRARRYRLTRTVFRGLRFDQHGSAWLYAVRALAWWAAIIVTLGLAYPWSRSSLERFKMRNTSYGDLPGRFEGSGFRLFLRGLPMWLAVVGPIVAGIVAMAALIDWDALSKAVADTDSDAFESFFTENPQFLQAIGAVFIAIGISVTIAVLLYPVFQAVLLRWWISGLRFGELTVTSRLRIRQIYRVYLRFILYVFLFALVVGVVGGVGISAIRAATRPVHDSNVNELVSGGVLMVLYVITMLGTSTIYQVVVAAGLWRLGAQSAELAGTAALNNVRATGVPSSALGEGLADALGVGSI
jgi:uncharacterized membrane protein YjgN (DUF898 family)